MDARKWQEYLKHMAMSLLVALTAMCVLIPVYVLARTTAEKLLTAQIESRLEAGTEAINRTVHDSLILSYNLRHSGTVSKLALMTDQDIRQQNNMALFQYYRDSKQYGVLNGWEREQIIQYRNNHLLLTYSRDFLNGADAVGQSLLYYKGLDYAAWREKLFTRMRVYWPATPVYTPEAGYVDCLTINRYYSYYLPNTVVVSTLVPIQEWTEGLLLDAIADRSFVWIESCAEGPLYENAPAALTDIADLAAGARRIGETDYQIWRYAQPANDLVIMVGVERGVFAEYLYPISHTIETCIILAILAALVCSGLYAFRYHRYIDELMPYLPSGGARTNLFGQIVSTMRSMTAMGEDLRLAYDRECQRLTRVALEHALAGLPLGEAELAALKTLAVFSGPYRLLVFRLSECDEGNLRALRRQGADWFGAAWNEAPQAVVSDQLIVAMGEEALAYAPFAHLREAFPDPCGLVGCGLSEVCAGAETLPLASQEARASLLLDERKPGGATQRDWTGLPPLSKYLDVQRLVGAGDAQQMEALFDEIMDWVCQEKPEVADVWHVIHILRQALAEAAAQYGFAEALPTGYAYPQISWQELWDYAERLCQARREQLKGRQSELAERILRFIEAEYRNPALCLTMLSEKFSLTECYLSALLKRQGDVNFAAYVEELRMREAMRLITESEETIDEIVEQTGYARKNTFYKAFKKTYGFPPSHFKNQAQNCADRP